MQLTNTFMRYFLALVLIASCGMVAWKLNSPAQAENAVQRQRSQSLDKQVPQVDASQQAERRDPITHEVEFAVTVTPPYQCKVLKVWLPLPPSDESQEISESELTTFPQEVEPKIETESVFGNTFAYFEFMNPQGAQIIRHKFTAKVWEVDWNLDPAQVADVRNWPSEFAPYLRPDAVNAEAQFNDVLNSFVVGPNREASAMDELLRAMEWVDSNLTYDHINASLGADVNHAFDQRRGHCSDYHGLCATMGRAMGYPACVTYGLALVPKASPSHCKMDVYLPPYGWVSFDLSETQKMVKAIGANPELSAERKAAYAQAARERLHGGFRENSWLLLTRGTNYELAPKASQPVKVVRTIYAEADGVPLPEPDPSNENQSTFAWMTAHKYTADKEFRLPFKDVTTLDARLSEGN